MALAFAALMAGGCGSDDVSESVARADSAAQVGEWQTWTIDSGGAVAVPAPPAEDGGAGAGARASDGYAVQPWLERSMELVSQRPKDPVRASRDYALAAVAMYDAAVAAAYWQARYAESGGGSYPSTEAAVAGAGSRVIAYTFPDYPAAQLDQDAEAVTRELVAGGAAESSVAAGLALGRAVARRTIAVGNRDGSDKPWRGRKPRFRGVWAPPPGSAARPVSPTGGTWKTWVLPSGSSVRPPPMPRYGSEEFRAEAQAVVDTRNSLTDEQKRIAEFWAGGDGTELPPGRWIRVVLDYLRDQPEMSQARAARVFALLTVAMDDAGIAAWDAKYRYWVTRPINAIRDLGIDPEFEPYLDTPFFPAYVSGHATYSGAAAEVLAYLFSDDAEAWRARAREAAQSRLYGGIHYPMDNTVGLAMGTEIGELVVERAKADGADQ